MNKFFKIGIVVAICAIIIVVRLMTAKTIDEKKADLIKSCESIFGVNNVLIECGSAKCYCKPVTCYTNMSIPISSCLKYLEDYVK